MKKSEIGWVVLAFVVSLIAVGIPYFSTSYQETDVTALFGVGSMLVVLFSVLLTAVVRAPVWLVAPVMSLVLPAVVVARIVADTAADPTSHNLWPFELVLVAGPALVFGAGGAVAGVVLRRYLLDKAQARPGS